MRSPTKKHTRTIRSPALHPRRPNETWLLDIVRMSGSYYMLAVVDPFTRQCIAHEVRKTCNANDVVRLLDRVVADGGAPNYLVIDRGLILTDVAIDRWATHRGAQIVSATTPSAKGQIERLFRALVADGFKIPGFRERGNSEPV